MLTDSPHRFLRFATPAADRPIVRDISVALLARYSGETKKRHEWRSLGMLQIPWWEEKRNDEQKLTKVDCISKPFDLHALEQHLRLMDGFDFNEFDLFDPACPWLDSEIRMATNMHRVDESNESETCHLSRSGPGT